MSNPICTSTTRTIVDSRPGAVVLSRRHSTQVVAVRSATSASIEWAGGRGRHRDRGRRRPVVAPARRRRRARPVTCELRVDADHRLRVASLHTTSHVLNAFVFDEFAGALVTGAQINGDGTGRMDFDLPEVDNDRRPRPRRPGQRRDRPRRRRATRSTSTPPTRPAPTGWCAACRSLPRRRPTAGCASSTSTASTVRRAVAPTSPTPASRARS